MVDNPNKPRLSNENGVLYFDMNFSGKYRTVKKEHK
jgi:hypothetical protein